MNRKEFLQSAGCICGAGFFAGLILSAESCAPKTQLFKATLNSGKAIVPLSLFESGNIQMVKVQGLEEKVGIVKKADGTYNAFELKCTHAGAALKPADGQFNCPLHGSKFDADGNVINGPAKKPLKKYKTVVQGENLELLIA